MTLPNLEIIKCKNCGKDFRRRKKSRGRGVRAKAHIRPCHTVTCSKKCSSIWTTYSRKIINDRKKLFTKLRRTMDYGL